MAYKLVAKKVHTVLESLDKEFYIVQTLSDKLLSTLQSLSSHPPDFIPGAHFTQGHIDNLELEIPTISPILIFTGLDLPHEGLGIPHTVKVSAKDNWIDWICEFLQDCLCPPDISNSAYTSPLPHCTA